MSETESKSTSAFTVSSPPKDFSGYPKNVGIVAMDIHFPRLYTRQEDLEKYKGVDAGKYTIGLGQTEIAYCTDREDIYSLALTAVSQFMTKYGVKYSDVGRLEVGTETILDHAKAVKTVLMQLFADSGNSDVEGIDCTNACYGGTNALFNSLAWVESSAWDGRFAMVVCGDIAEYADGPARPTSGAGVVVMLMGPNAPLVIERGVRSTHMEHVYDFYKPNLHSLFPVVDGALSQTCYLKSVDKCYAGYTAKFERIHGRPFIFADDTTVPATPTTTPASSMSDQDGTNQSSPKRDVDYFVFHAPYNKLVQKSVARLFYSDSKYRSSSSSSSSSSSPSATSPAASRVDASLSPFSSLPYDTSLTSKELEQTVTKLSKTAYATMTAPSTLLPTRLGNLYTASLYAGLISLVSTKASDLAGKRVLCFSYGSGLAASLFSIVIPQGQETIDQLNLIKTKLNVEERLKSRTLTTPKDLDAALDNHEKNHGVVGVYVPQVEVSSKNLFEGSYYLVKKDEKGRRQYEVFHG